MNIFFGLIVSLLCSSALAQSKGEVYEDSLKVKDSRNSTVVFDIPLAPGKWSVENVVLRSSTGSTRAAIKDVRLIRVQEGVLQEAMEITAKVDSSSLNWLDEPCKVEPVLYKNDYGTRLWKQKCLTITPITFLQSNNDATRLLLKELADRSIRHDFNSIRVTYTRLGDFSKFLIIAHHIFPSNYGLENPVIGIINTSPYHPSLIGSGNERRKFIDALAKYFEDVVIAYDAAYEGKEGKKRVLFKWPDSSSLPSGDLSQKLELLEKSFSAGLLTNEEYQKKRSELISK